MYKVIAYTDGACSGNPGPGGWGVVLQATDAAGRVLKTRTLCGGEAHTTNNRMELMAAITALETLNKNSNITLITDSIYVRDGITKWLAGWRQKNWKTASKKPVKNVDLWQRLDGAQATHTVDWQWIKGHAGHAGNEQADALAREGMQPFKEYQS